MVKAAGTMSDSDSLLWSIGSDPVLQTPVLAVALLDRPPYWTTLAERVALLVEVVPRLRSRVASFPLGVRRPGGSKLASSTWVSTCAALRTGIQ